MPLRTFTAVSLFTAVTLFALVLPLLLPARRRLSAALLATFLSLVAINFLLPGLRCWYLPCYTDGFFLQIERLTLALDPVFLLAFVLAYGSVELKKPVALPFAAVATASAGAALLILFTPEGGAALSREIGRSWLHALLIANLVVAYLASWIVALTAYRAAPTPRVRQRHRWLAITVGIAVLPRMALIPFDLGLKDFFDFGPPRAWIRSVDLPLQSTSVLATLLVGSLTLLAAYMLARRLHRGGRGWENPLSIAGAVALGLYALNLATAALPVVFSDNAYALYTGGTASYGLRWIAFAGILTHGMLSGELVEFQRLSMTYVSVVGGILGGVAAALAAGVVATSLGTPDDSAAVYALAVGLGATLPSSAGSRTLLRVLDRLVPQEPEVARRITLYRAALELAWSAGPPDNRKRRTLERDRRTWGVTLEEARTLEHLMGEARAGEPTELQPGDELAPGFRVERALGQGSEAHVFQVRAEDSGERLVAKVLDSRRGRDAEAFLREVRVLQTLHHPNVVRLVDAGMWRGRRILFFEDREAVSLREVLARGPPSEERVRQIGQDLLAGLAAAHAHGIVHGDIKPENVLIDKTGRAMLTDFALASTNRRPRDARATVTDLGALTRLAGTLAYMAPEQARGEPLSTRTDAFAAGLVLHEALRGRPARALHAQAGWDAWEATLRGRVEWDGVPPAWRRVLEHALSPHPPDRFADASAFLRAMNDASLAP